MKKFTEYLFGSVVLALAVLFLFAACSKPPGAKIDTEKVYTAAELPAGFKGDTAYGQVNSKWLPEFYKRWRTELFDKGVVRWEGRFDCNKFAAAFCSSAQIEYYMDNFHTWTPGQALAVGEVWYKPDAAGGKGHAVIVAMTERGAVYIEPQTGGEITMTSRELESVFFKRF